MNSFSIDKQRDQVNAEWMSRPVDDRQPLALVLISMEQSLTFAYRLKRKLLNGPIFGGAYTGSPESIKKMLTHARERRRIIPAKSLLESFRSFCRNKIKEEISPWIDPKRIMVLRAIMVLTLLFFQISLINLRIAVAALQNMVDTIDDTFDLYGLE